MAYNVEHLAKLAALKALAEKINTDFARQSALTALSDKVDEIVEAGGEPNKIEVVKVNGTALAITDKAVDVKVPEYTIEKEADSGDYAAIYKLMKDGVAAGAAINIPKDMVVKSGSVVTNPEGQAEGTYIKLVLQNVKDPLYIDVGGLIEYVTSGSAAGDMVVVSIDETTHKVTATITDGTVTKAKLHADVQASLDKADSAIQSSDLAPYAKTTDVANGYVAKNGTDRLMTAAEGTKLAGISEGANKVEKSDTNGNIKVDGSEVVVYTEPSDVVHGTIATDTEVTEMLNEVFVTE